MAGRRSMLLGAFVLMITLAAAPLPAAPEERPVSRRLRRLAGDDGGIGDVGGLLTGVFAVIITLVGIVIVLSASSDLLPDVFASLAGIVDTFETNTTGNATADSMLPTFGLLIAIAGAIGLVALILNATGLTGRQG